MVESPRVLAWAAALSIAAGLVHGALVDSHFEEWWGYGVFFMLATMAQGFYGGAILASHLLNGSPIAARWSPASRRAFYVAGILGNVAIVALYVLTRTVGIPLFGPEAGEVEPWDPLGLVSKSIEVALVALLALLHRAAAQPP